MDRKEKPKTGSNYANEREISEGTASVLPSGAAHKDNKGAEPGTLGADDIAQPVGARPRSSVTGRHDPGTGANETIDGLSETEEMTRISAEDVPPGDAAESDEPVFDRAEEVVRR
jgi:hypothetical protein